MEPNHCPQKDDLTGYLNGKLPEQVRRAIDEHIDTCCTCELTLAKLAGEPDSFVGLLRQTVPLPEYESEPSFCRAVEQILDLLSCEDAEAGARISETKNVPSIPSLPFGTVGPYQLLEVLGEGGMGVVYRARHIRLERVVAIKLLPAERFRRTSAIRRFEREMAAVGAFDHPNVVRALDAGQDAGVLYLVMEYIPGINVSELARRTGPLSIADACEIVRQAALGIEETHRHHLIHRDIKPSNLMLTSLGCVKVLDLGLALFLSGSNNDPGDLTRTGAVLGTLDYMAPEQCGDSHDVDIRTDIYGLGATLYKLLTGVAPFVGVRYRSLELKVAALHANSPTSICELRSEVPDALAQVVHRMLAKRPSDRFATAGEVARVLTGFCEGANLEGRVRACGMINNLSPGNPSGQKPAARPSGSTDGETAKPQRAFDAAMSAERTLATRKSACSLVLFLVLCVPILLTVLLHTNSASILMPSPRLAVPSPDDSLALDRNDAPFMLLRNGQTVRRFCTLSKLATEVRDGDVVELQHSLPLEVDSWPLQDRDLTFRSAPGQRGELRIEGTVQVRGELVFQGVDVRVGEGIRVATDGGRLQMRGCRLAVPTLALRDRATVALIDSLVLIELQLQHGGGGKLILQNCAVVLDNHPILLQPARGGAIRCERCTIWRAANHALLFRAAPGRTLDSRGALPIEAVRNVFLFAPSLEGEFGLAAPAKFATLLAWTADANGYYPTPLSPQSIKNKGVSAQHGLEALSQVTGSPENEAVIFESPPVFLMERQRSAATSAQFQNGVQERIVPIYDRHQLATAGPGWERIGPGEAYTQARNASDETHAARDHLPRALPGGPVVIVRGGRDQAGYPQPDAALRDATDGDVVEIRSSTAFDSVRFHGHQRRLVLRAGTGYVPQIESISNDGSDRIELHGLEIRQRVVGVPGSAGRLVRISNCRLFAGSMRTHDAQTGHVSVQHAGAEGIEIRNCIMDGGIELPETDGTRVRITNTVCAAVSVGRSGKGLARLELDRVVCWSPAPYPTNDSRSPRTPAIRLASSTRGGWQVVARGCLFEAGQLVGDGMGTRSVLSEWVGSKNIYRIWYPGWRHDDRQQPIRHLSGWRARFVSDGDSVEEDPLIWQPDQWLLNAADPELAERGVDVQQLQRSMGLSTASPASNEVPRRQSSTGSRLERSAQ